MPFCRFSKVYEGTSWLDLKFNMQYQISKKCKEMEYLELATIVVDSIEFGQICNDLSCARDCYRKYAHRSVATLDGKWQCLIIQNQNHSQKIILYMAGCLYPLYAAILE